MRRPLHRREVFEVSCSFSHFERVVFHFECKESHSARQTLPLSVESCAQIGLAHMASHLHAGWEYAFLRKERLQPGAQYVIPALGGGC